MNFGAQTDPYPYIIGAYIVGSLLIFGYGAYLIAARNKLENLLIVMKEESNND